MPFPMVHLCIAYNILNNTPQIKKPCDFLLGAIAPDSVHKRNNFMPHMKKISHLCVGNEVWGQVTNNKEWQESVFAFLQRNKNTQIRDFIYGYCVHILTDIQNNKNIWMPFILANKDELKKGYGSTYHEEAFAVDHALYLLHPHQTEIRQMLENSVGYDIANVVVGDEIDKLKDHLLKDQFNDSESTDLSFNKYVTLSNMNEFISNESQYIKKIMFSSN